MEIVFTPKALSDRDEWKKNGNTKVQKKIEELLNSITNTPFSGIGKPEPLRYEMSGKWSRRITIEHRMVYSVDNEILTIYSLKGHYNY